MAADGRLGAGWIAAGLPVALLFVATWYYGAFAIHYWAPVAILALAVLAAAAFGGGLRVPERGARIALGAIWALAAWALLSALWAQSPSGAIEGASRTALYAALFAIPCAMLAGARDSRRLAALLEAGIGAIAAVTLVRLLVDGPDLFLAGRLEYPVGYRNATGCLCALGFWPFVARAADHDGNAFLRALALAGAVLVIGLAFLTQARGVVLGLAAGGVVALALGPDRLRRGWLAIAALAALALAWDRLLEPFRAFRDGGEAGAADVVVAADALVLLVVLVFALGLVVALVDGGLRLHGGAREAMRDGLRATLALLGVVAVVVAVATVGDVGSYVDARAKEFRGLETASSGETRLTFAGGQRADLWRVALIELRERPLTGVGEGGYRFGYYEERRTDRNLSAPHSLVFRIAAELGLVGLLCLLLFVGGVTAAVAARWRGASEQGRRRASALLALATVGMAQGAVDWLWLVPAVTGLTVLALGLAVLALRPAGDEPEAADDQRSRSPRARGASLAAGAGLVLAMAVVAWAYLGDLRIREARAVDPARPAERLEAAERAERLNPWSPTPLYLQAGALEDLGRRGEARRRLRAALREEPRNFVTIALLGDLEARAGRPRVARAHYRRALELNPRDVGLRKLARRGG